MCKMRMRGRIWRGEEEGEDEEGRMKGGGDKGEEEREEKEGGLYVYFMCFYYFACVYTYLACFSVSVWSVIQSACQPDCVW